MAPLLRLIAVLPPEPLAGLVRAEQERIAATWGPRQALRTPPHITLIPPIQVDEREIDVLERIADEIARAHTSFTLRLRGYGAFSPRVLFMKPMLSRDLEDLYLAWRRSLADQLPRTLDKYPDKPFRPHMTLAHRDVEPAQFDAMWAHYGERRLDISFKVRSFAVLDNTRAGWVVRREFVLGKSAAGNEQLMINN